MVQPEVLAPSAFALSLYGLVLCSLYGFTATLAQTLSAPLDALNSSIYGQSIYIYNPASQSIVSPVQNSHQLTLIPWRDYNSTMQWTLTLDGTGPTVLISAVSPQAAACPAGTTAFWSADKEVPVITLCSPNLSQYINFNVIPSGNQSYCFLANANPSTCVTIVNNVPVSPNTVCNREGAETQWQLVTISASPPQTTTTTTTTQPTTQPTTTTRPTTYPPSPRVVMKSACDSASGSPLASTLWFSSGSGQCLVTNNGSISMTCGVGQTVNLNYYSDALCQVPASSGTFDFNDVGFISFNFPLQQCIPSLNWIVMSCGLQPPPVPSPVVGLAVYRSSFQSNYNLHPSSCDVFDFQNSNVLNTCIPNSAGSFMQACSSDGTSVINTQYSDAACTKNPVVFTWPMNTCADMWGNNVQFVDVFSCNGAT